MASLGHNGLNMHTMTLLVIWTLFCILYAIFDNRTFKFDTNVVVRVAFDISSGFVIFMVLYLYPLHNVILSWNEMDSIWIDNSSKHGKFKIAFMRMPQNNFDVNVGQGNDLGQSGKITLSEAMLTQNYVTINKWCSTSLSSNVDPSTSLSYEMYDNEMNKCKIYGTNLSNISNQWQLKYLSSKKQLNCLLNSKSSHA